MNAFFTAFKTQIKSVVVKTDDIIQFVKGTQFFLSHLFFIIASSLAIKIKLKISTFIFVLCFAANYPEFHLHLIESHNDNVLRINENDFVFIYSLLLHFSCILHADQKMQSVCSHLGDKNQTMIAKFLESLIDKNTSYTRASIQEAIDEAGKL